MQPAVVPGSLSLSNGGNAALVTASADGAKFALDWPGKLPTPSLVQDRATYADVVPGVDLVVQALPVGFEQFIVLKSKPSKASSFTLPITLTGLTTTEQPAGATELRDAKGKRVGAIGSAYMFDSSDKDRPKQNPMASSVRKTSAGAELTLTPDAAVLDDPATVYPVVLDPVISLVPAADTYVKGSNTAVNYGTDTKLAVGQITSVATDDNRGLVVFTGVGALAGKQISAARVKLAQYYSVSCTPSLTAIHQNTQGWTETGATWANQPTVDTTAATSLTHATGGTCGATAYQTFPNTASMVNLVGGWADGTIANYGLQLRANESSTAGGKYFYSSETSMPPLLDVTYNSVPGTPAGRAILPCTAQCPSVTLTSSATPKLTAQSSDADGDALTYTFEVYAGTANPPGAGAIYTGTATSPPGQKVYWQVPGALSNGASYEYRVKATDSTGASSNWTTYSLFTVDTSAPLSPTVSATPYASNTWNSTLPVPAGTFTFTKNVSNTDVYEYAWRTDDNQSGSTLSTAASNTQTITPQAGWRTLLVATVDKAGNRSPETTFTFGANAAVTSPGAGASTQRYAHLKAVAPPNSGSVTWKYKLQASDAWTTIPLAAITYANLAPVTAWPVTTTTDATKSSSPELIFDLPQVLGGTGTAQDGAVLLRAEFTGTANNNTVNDPTVTLDQNAFGGSYATKDIGPGSVSLLTGNFSVSATDANIDSYGSDLTLSRTFNSRTATTPGLFGPGWLPSLAVDSASSDYTSLADLGSSVTVTDSSGAKLVFAKTGTGGTYVAVGDAEGLKLIGSGGDNNGATTFDLSDDDGAKTTFSVTSNWGSTATLTTPHAYPVTGIVQAGDASATTYTYVSGRPTRILAPHPTGLSTCNTTFVTGCRALDLRYTSVLGNQQISKATLKTDDGTGTIIDVDVACFSYDAAGRLYQAWDPRINATTCNFASPVLPITYNYDTTGRIASITPPGLAAWNITYEGTTLTSRLSSVSRTHTGGTYGTGTETSSVRYDIPITNDTDAITGLHPDLSSTTIATWAQTDQPLTAAAVFAPGDTVPDAPYTGDDFRDGTITALNAEGREVNSAVYTGTGQAGWRIDTSEYDDAGHELRTLTAANRDRALGRPDAGAITVSLPSDTAAAARMLDTTNFYATNPNDPDPQQATELDLVDTFGPLHAVTIPGASTPVPAREHTHVTYDTGSESGHPGGGTMRLEVASTVGASLSGAATATNEADQRTTTSTYSLAGEATGWNLRTPVRTTSYTGTGTSGTAISSTTITDASTGLVTETRMPSDTAGATAGTTLNTYYTAGTTNNANCINTAWVQLLCKVAPKAQPGDPNLPGLVTKQVTYDYLLRPVVTTETAAPANGTGTPVTRVTTTTYETAGKSPRVASVAITGGLGTALPAQTSSYDSTNGLPVTTAATGLGSALTTAYDDFGRVTSFTDADASTTVTSYDSRGRISSTSQTVAGGVKTTALAYDTTSIVSGGSDHRGMVTSSTTTDLGGAFTAVYDGGGALRTQTYPNGLTADYVTDETGDVTKVTYSKSATVWFADSQSSNIHGQWITHNGLPSTQTYTYDGLGRLTNAIDDSNSTDGCVQRTYAFANTAGLDSNRSSLVTYPAALNGDCQSTTSTTQSLSYDTADRLSPTGPAAGLAYDTFGRTTSLPAALTGASNTAVTNNFYTNDLVSSQSTTTRTKTWQLDPSQNRFRTFTDNASGSTITKTNHYSDASSDSPDWIDEATGNASGSATVNTPDLDGNLGAVTTYAKDTGINTTAFQLANLHGDVVTTTSPSAATFDGAVLDSDEFGNPKPSNPGSRYGWLGGKQRSADALGGIMLMGVRLYAATSGRFLTVDPVPGGSANAYDYVNQDPVNGFDLDGRKCHAWSVSRKCRGKFYLGAGKRLSQLSFALSFVPGAGALGSAAAGIWSSNFYKLGGDNSAGNRQLVSTGVNAALGAVGWRLGKTIFVKSRAARVISGASHWVTGNGIGTVLCGRPWTGCSKGFGRRPSKHHRSAGGGGGGGRMLAE